MKTDWNLIRELMTSVIDACEAVENLDLAPEDRDAPLPNAPATIWDALQSSWTYPENVQYQIIRARHEADNDKPYTPESARALVNVAKLCAELIEAGDTPSTQAPVKTLAHWYTTHMVPQVTEAIQTKRQSVPTPQ